MLSRILLGRSQIVAQSLGRPSVWANGQTMKTICDDKNTSRAVKKVKTLICEDKNSSSKPPLQTMKQICEEKNKSKELYVNVEDKVDTCEVKKPSKHPDQPTQKICDDKKKSKKTNMNLDTNITCEGKKPSNRTEICPKKSEESEGTFKSENGKTKSDADKDKVITPKLANNRFPIVIALLAAAILLYLGLCGNKKPTEEKDEPQEENSKVILPQQFPV